MMAAPRRPSTRPDAPSDFDRVRAWANVHLRDLLRDYAPEAFAKRHGDRLPCPMHGGEERNLALFDNPTGAGELWRCHSACGTSGGGVELVQRLTGRTGKEGALEVLRELAPRAGVLLEDRVPRSSRDLTQVKREIAGAGGLSGVGGTGAGRPPRGTPSGAPALPKPDPALPFGMGKPLPEAVETALRELRDGGAVPASRSAVFGTVLEVLTLGPSGRDYLAGRGFDPDAAAAYGFRSVEHRDEWARLLAELAADYHPAELAAANLATLPEHRTPALVLPYTTPEGAAWTFRTRALAEGLEPRYATLKGDAIPYPFNAPALAGLTREDELHLVEGELNAYALHVHGLRACSAGAAGTWRSEWTAAVARAGRLVAWFDNDPPEKDGRPGAGERGFAALRDRLNGLPRAALAGLTLVRQTIPREGEKKVDLNDLHRRGELAPYLEGAPWRT